MGWRQRQPLHGSGSELFHQDTMESHAEAGARNPDPVVRRIAHVAYLWTDPGRRARYPVLAAQPAEPVQAGVEVFRGPKPHSADGRPVTAGAASGAHLDSYQRPP